jgi:hypothetical protein
MMVSIAKQAKNYATAANVQILIVSKLRVLWDMTQQCLIDG